MLAKAHRLRKPSEFQRVRAEGRCWSAALLVVCRHPNALPISRFGFSASKRIGKAVVRNRVKRQMREAVRLQQDLILPGWDVVWIARQPIALASYADIEQAVTRLLGISGLLVAGGGAGEQME